MYRKYVGELGPESEQSQQQPVAQQKQQEMSEEDQWRKQWVSKSADDLWKSLQSGGSKSLLKKHLTEARFKDLKDKSTSLGGTLAQCMSSGEYFFGYFGIFLLIVIHV